MMELRKSHDESRLNKNIKQKESGVHLDEQVLQAEQSVSSKPPVLIADEGQQPGGSDVADPGLLKTVTEQFVNNAM